MEGSMARFRQCSFSLGVAAAAFGLCSALISNEAVAWDSSGHRLIGELALKSLPPELPEFLRKAEAARQVAEVAREPDRAKGASAAHDSDANAAHHVNVSDDLKIARGPLLSTLPPNRETYDTALRALGTNQYRAGYLPYAIIDAWQQVVMDFAYWRADVAGARYARTPAERTWFLQDQWVREGLTIRDLGLLAHFVGDGSQPMLVSIHSDGWGNYPNPQSFTTARFRAVFEGTIVRSKITPNDISANVAPYRDCRCMIERRTSDYLIATQKDVAALYQIEKAGGFAARLDNGKIFVSKRLAAGVAELRDMIADAWRRSGEMSVGSPPMPVEDIETGEMNAFDALRGVD
jgi:hypothetical protein